MPLEKLANVLPTTNRIGKRASQSATNAVSPLLAITPGPARILRSSASLPWQGFLLERHLTSPGERAPVSTDMHVISLLCGSARFDYCATGSSSAPPVARPGSVTMTPAGPVPFVRLHTPADFIHCALEKRFTLSVIEEMDPRPSIVPTFRTDVQDAPIQRILTLLFEELETETPFGRVYVDSLAHALAVRYLMLGVVSSGISEPCVSALPSRILRRVQEKIEACLHTDLSLNSLAEESGYSRAHFLRMFRVATGVTPHQYILELRLRHAQESLRRKTASLIDVAALCGFASQSHMTSVFRQRLGVTPAEFRRDCTV